MKLVAPPATRDYYRQIAVLAYPLHRGAALAGAAGDARRPLAQLKFKSAAAEMGFSMPDASGLLVDASPATDEDMTLPEVKDIGDAVDADGTVRWRPPAGDARPWEVLRVGYTISGAKVSTASGEWQGLSY